MNYKYESACGEALFERIDELELLSKYGNDRRYGRFLEPLLCWEIRQYFMNEYK